MIKQFNFYDIYGYLLPGMLLLAILWLPIGLLTESWPEQDLSKALFLAALAYIVGHLIQIVATILVPSKEKDAAGHLRVPSDRILDKSYNDKGAFSSAFKTRLATHIFETFGLDIAITQDGKGDDDTSKTRSDAFFQARAYLIAKKNASYVEQFEGLYVMMRGLCCSFCVGGVYLGGWSIALYRERACVWAVFAALSALFSIVLLSSGWLQKPNPDLSWTRFLWFGVFLCAGFWARFLPSALPTSRKASHFEFLLLAGVVFCFIAAAKCFSSYKSFARHFGASVWRDFATSLSTPADTPSSKPTAESSDDE